MKEYDKMISGSLYRSAKEELVLLANKSRALLDQINQTSHADFDTRRTLFKELFGALGKEAFINKPFYCDYGVNIEIGDNFYANFDLTILDVAKVTIGDRVMFGPKVSILSATHPIDHEVRSSGLELGAPITIGNDVWIGGNVVINPGVIIGDRVIIGSGSVVTKDIPSDMIAAGNPCRVIRAINDDDKKYWEQQKIEYHLK